MQFGEDKGGIGLIYPAPDRGISVTRLTGEGGYFRFPQISVTIRLIYKVQTAFDMHGKVIYRNQIFVDLENTDEVTDQVKVQMFDELTCFCHEL